MGIAERKICPSCAGIISAKAILCSFCGTNLQSDLNTIVPDGKDFGIAVRGQIRIHGLKLANAKKIARILNELKVS